MVTTATLFASEDKFVGMRGLYLLWTSFFIADMAVLCTDSTSGNPRDFNVLVSLISTLFVSFASYNTIYGNKLPSSMKNHDLVVIFGGPMSANEELNFIKYEIEWLKIVIKSGIFKFEDIEITTLINLGCSLSG